MNGTTHNARNQESTSTTQLESPVEKRTFAGDSIEELLTSALRSLLESEENSVAATVSSSRTLRIRGEGNDVGRLLLDLSRSLTEETETMQLHPVEIGIDGIVRSESGIIGWASVTVVEPGATSRPAQQITGIIDQRNERHDHAVSVAIRRGR